MKSTDRRLMPLFFLLCSITYAADKIVEAQKSFQNALKDTSTLRLEKEQRLRENLASDYPKEGFEGPVETFTGGLNRLKSAGIIPTLKPSDSTRLHEWTYLCTHNAFSSKAHQFGLYRQQNLSMTEQLNRGVRALMLDTWMANNVIRLTHGPPQYDKLLRGVAGGNIGSLFQEGMHFKKELEALRIGFFDKAENAGEVVFILLENYVESKAALDQALVDSGLAPKILKRSEWDATEQKGWPTFKWMREHKKQIIFFSDRVSTPYIYPLRSFAL